MLDAEIEIRSPGCEFLGYYARPVSFGVGERWLSGELTGSILVNSPHPVLSREKFYLWICSMFQARRGVERMLNDCRFYFPQTGYAGTIFLTKNQRIIDFAQSHAGIEILGTWKNPRYSDMEGTFCRAALPGSPFFTWILNHANLQRDPSKGSDGKIAPSPIKA